MVACATFRAIGFGRVPVCLAWARLVRLGEISRSRLCFPATVPHTSPNKRFMRSKPT